jgi:dihydrodipicolinate reductase
MKVGEIINFIEINKKDKVFIGLTLPQIVWEVLEAIKKNSIWVIVNDNTISGMILASIDHEHKKIFITRNLAMTLANLKHLAQKAKKEFVGYTIEAMRHDCHRKFNTEKLYKKLS